VYMQKKRHAEFLRGMRKRGNSDLLPFFMTVYKNVKTNNIKDINIHLYTIGEDIVTFGNISFTLEVRETFPVDNAWCSSLAQIAKVTYIFDYHLQKFMQFDGNKYLALNMSESIVKEEFGVNFNQYISFYNIENSKKSNKVVWEHNTKIGIKVKESSYLHEFCQTSTYGNFEINVKEEIEVREEPILIEGDEIKCKNELETKEEPMAFTRETYQRSKCDKAFSHNNALINHQRTHTWEKPYQCSQCDKAFSHKGNLTSHQKTHTGEKPYQCSQCDKAFSQKGNLARHQETHTGEKSYLCSQCDKAVSDKSTLIRHQRIHTGEKPYQCSQCDKVFAENGSLMKHQRTHTGEKPYLCSQCDKAFSHNNALINHQRTHTWGKPYQCSQCDKAFSQKSSLTIHQKTHTGKKPYQCSQCEKAFLRKHNLKEHHRSHTGEKPYQCSQCDKAFSVNKNLKYHQSRKHSLERNHINEASMTRLSHRPDIL
ncbi:unnamed protein product, partial [Meganyctiphanes norvegica]